MNIDQKTLYTLILLLFISLTIVKGQPPRHSLFLNFGYAEGHPDTRYDFIPPFQRATILLFLPETTNDNEYFIDLGYRYRIARRFGLGMNIGYSELHNDFTMRANNGYFKIDFYKAIFRHWSIYRHVQVMPSVSMDVVQGAKITAGVNLGMVSSVSYHKRIYNIRNRDDIFFFINKMDLASVEIYPSLYAELYNAVRLEFGIRLRHRKYRDDAIENNGLEIDTYNLYKYRMSIGYRIAGGEPQVRKVKATKDVRNHHLRIRDRIERQREQSSSPSATTHEVQPDTILAKESLHARASKYRFYINAGYGDGRPDTRNRVRIVSYPFPVEITNDNEYFIEALYRYKLTQRMGIGVNVGYSRLLSEVPVATNGEHFEPSLPPRTAFRRFYHSIQITPAMSYDLVYHKAFVLGANLGLVSNITYRKEVKINPFGDSFSLWSKNASLASLELYPSLYVELYDRVRVDFGVRLLNTKFRDDAFQNSGPAVDLYNPFKYRISVGYRFFYENGKLVTKH
ncbi:MAG TPA: hypothetical protein PKC30_07380 [Saprospiraceae bacterium]|nr:hypothetical protein [Saprospiraceae bacterium]